jgi:hypothetical protein
MLNTRVLFWVALALIVTGLAGVYLSRRSAVRYPLSVVHVSIPKFSKDNPTTAAVTRTGGMVRETLLFPGTSMQTAEKYSDWFKKHDWRTASESQDVTTWKAVFSKDTVVISIDFNPSRGTYLQGSRPEREYDAPQK